MPAESKEANQSAEQQEDTALLDNMESTLQEMRWDDSYDDVDNLADDAADTLDQRAEETGDDEQTQEAG